MAAGGGGGGRASSSSAAASSSSAGALEASLDRKLQAVTNTMESIQGLSSWCLENKRHHSTIVYHWMKWLRRCECGEADRGGGHTGSRGGPSLVLGRVLARLAVARRPSGRGRGASGLLRLGEGDEVWTGIWDPASGSEVKSLRFSVPSETGCVASEQRFCSASPCRAQKKTNWVAAPERQHLRPPEFCLRGARIF